MRRRVGRATVFGVLAGVATAAVAVAVRPRGGTGVLVDWDDVRSAARAHLDQPATPGTVLAAAEKRYRAMAEDLDKPLLDFVGRLPVGVQMPRFEAIDREGWLDLNLAILRRVIDPVLELGRVPNSLIVDAGRAGIDRYVGFMLAFLGR
ncbi:MAG TPA: zinc-dependent metalloprotease, partial [Methylomirabilota bacterium]|nr:zinc-dependent metalloprotease [Methylomirabilota bacterium]